MPHDPTTYRFFLMTVDPVHVGTGGMRLGRVDNPIVREPGTRVPKIPGTALHGAIRAYAAHRFGKPGCAGQGQKEGRKHCGRPTCPICYTFGFARDQEGGSSGVVAVGDARILLFPVYSMVGPVWVTCPGVLCDAGFYPDNDPNKYFEVESPTQDQNQDQNNKEESKTAKAKWPDTLSKQDYLNLGWLMVKREKNGHEWKPEEILKDTVSGPIRNRAVLVSDKLFSQIVNSNLEVRTSVAINPETGAAEEGALFTYEAIPRATVLWMEVVESDFRRKFPSKEKLIKLWNTIKNDWKEQIGKLPDIFPEDGQAEEKIKKTLPILEKAGFSINEEIPSKDDQKNHFWKQFKWALEGLYEDTSYYKEFGNDWKDSLNVVQAGLQWIEHLGVGGMGTRGFGRIREITHCYVKQNTLECNQSNAKSKNQNNNSGGKDVGNNS